MQEKLENKLFTIKSKNKRIQHDRKKHPQGQSRPCTFNRNIRANAEHHVMALTGNLSKKYIFLLKNHS